MKKVERLLNRQEQGVDRILRHRLPQQSYQIFPCVRLQDVIKRGWSARAVDEHLPADVFDFWRMSHLDFVVATRDRTEPLFAVEFDGPYHRGPEQVARDILKNRLCKEAGLPLLRI